MLPNGKNQEIITELFRERNPCKRTQKKEAFNTFDAFIGRSVSECDRKMTKV